MSGKRRVYQTSSGLWWGQYCYGISHFPTFIGMSQKNPKILHILQHWVLGRFCQKFVIHIKKENLKKGKENL